MSLILPTTLYVILRVGITLALLHPSLNLTIKIYHELVEPIVNKYENKIDGFI